MAVHFRRVDVRRLLATGVEPLPEIRRRVAALKPSEGIAVVAPFLPSPLIELLRSENFTARAEHQADGSWITYFWRDEPDE
jgi:hypothetical protein